MKEGKFPHGYYSGISGLQLPIPKYKFPPEYQSSTRLTYYASLFNSIEINSSFYKVPSEKTVAKWANEVPDYFRFTFKLWEGVSHVKDLMFNESDVVNFVKVINQAGIKAGSLLIQLPPALRNNSVNQLIKLLNIIRTSDPSGLWQVAVEFRNKTWYTNSIYDLVESCNAAIVVHDKTGSSAPVIQSSVNFVYIRFHGPTGDYRGSYSEDFLSEYAEYIKQWMADGKIIYVYFNNTMGGAINNLNKLNQFLMINH